MIFWKFNNTFDYKLQDYLCANRTKNNTFITFAYIC